MIYFPFDNASANDLDRNVSSDVYADYMASFFTNGVDMVDSSTAFQVSAGDAMTVNVQSGRAVIGGRFCKETTLRNLIVTASGADTNRIDNVVLRLNKQSRTIDLYVVAGTPASVPVAPTPTRDSDVYEIVLAQIYIAKTVTGITTDRITDTRLDTSLCGVVSTKGQTVDTQSIFDQYQTALNSYLALVQSAIDGTTAGNLQTQITTNTNNITTNTTNITSLQTNKQKKITYGTTLPTTGTEGDVFILLSA